MSRNLLKSGFVTYQADEKRIIDTGQLFARKLEQLQRVEPALDAEIFQTNQDTDYDEGMDPEQARALFGEEESATIYREIDPQSVQPEETEMPDTQGMLQQAKDEIEKLRQQTEEELEQLRIQTLQKAEEEGYAKGYKEAVAKAQKELVARRNALEQEKEQFSKEYEQKLTELEPLFVDHLTKIYEHVFQVSFQKDREILLHLIDVAIHKIDSGKDFVIRVAKDDYPLISMQKKKLISNIAGASIDVIEDMALEKGQCLIETGGGIFDCSVDMELQELGRKMRCLAHQNDEGK